MVTQTLGITTTPMMRSGNDMEMEESKKEQSAMFGILVFRTIGTLGCAGWCNVH